MTVGPADVESAAERIGPHVRRTPVLDLDLDGLVVTAKLELLQHTGSFKPRGAFNRVLAADSIPEAGLIAASGGNHGLAVAYVARSLGHRAEIFVTEVTPEVKRAGIRALGARLVIGGRHYPDALEASLEHATKTGALQIHAYDHRDTVAGQGTMARELESQVPSLDTVLIGVGGGGLAAGAAAWFQDRVTVVAVEPAGSAALHRAMVVGAPVDVDIDSIAADSLGARAVGQVPFAALQAGRVHSVLVDDGWIRRAQRWFWDRVRLVVEPGGAAATAALLSGAYRPHPGERVAVVVCGANADLAGIFGPPFPGD
jgi:threonine dehydratase